MTPAIRMRGIPASPGIAIAPARVVAPRLPRIPRQRIERRDATNEVARLMAAVSLARRQLEAARASVSGQGGSRGDPALIIDAHLLMLDDALFLEGAAAIIREHLVNAEWALHRKTEEIRQTLAGLGDEYLRERAQDVAFVTERVLRNLVGQEIGVDVDPVRPSVIVAETLSPGDTAHLAGRPVLGFATEAGTRISHTALMAQALGIAAVVGVERLLERVGQGDVMIIDGTEGLLIIRPDEATIRDYEQRRERLDRAERILLADRDLPATTRDGVRVSLMCNIELPAETALGLDAGADGIGLYRTEFLFLDRPDAPSEDEQYGVYRAVIEAAAPRPVVFRTFDLGADKLTGQGEKTMEQNPALGLRAIRWGLKNRAMFKTQMRAMIRAARHGEIHVMFPMVSGVGELRQVKTLLEEARREIQPDEPKPVRVGCMIELPSAVLTARDLAREVDFFSIGTNDLIQYSLGIDRTNDQVAYLYTPLHPAVLRSIQLVVEAGKAAGIPVAMCGEMAAEPRLAPLLVGLGLRSLSMAPTAIPQVKKAIRVTDAEEAKALAERVLAASTALEAEDLLRAYFAGRPLDQALD